jgi:hypothetical protein
MTLLEKTPLPWKEGQDVKIWDTEIYETPRFINGKVIGVGDESMDIQWEDLNEPTEYFYQDMPNIFIL